jgi:hypothetical protein
LLANANAAPGYVTFIGTFAPPAGVYNVMGFRWKDGVIDQVLNDFNVGHWATTITPTNGSTPLRIGRRTDGATQLLGNLAEVLIYKPALSDTDTALVISNYLRPRWGLNFDILPSVAITSPTSGATVAANTPIPMTLSVSDPDGYVSQVQVFNGSTLLGSSTAPNTNGTANYQLMLAANGAGNLTLTASALDNYGRWATSAPVVVTVTNTASTTPVATGLKVWLAADRGVTTDLNGGVTNWVDQSGNANNAVQQVDATAEPLLVTNALNGKPVLRFDGTNGFLEVPDAGTAFLTNDFTTYAVARFAGSYPTVAQTVWSKCDYSGYAAPVDWWLTPSTGLPRGLRGDGTFSGGTGSGTAAPPLGQYTALGMKVTASNGVMAHYLGFADNGSSTALTNTANGGPLRIGRRLDGLTQLNGDIAEVLIYDQALSATDRSNVVSYLSRKYGLVSAAYASPPPVVSITSPPAGATLVAPSTVIFSVAASSPWVPSGR